MKRTNVLADLGRVAGADDLFVSWSGSLADAWWNHRPHGADSTLTLGVLGSISTTALGLSVALPHRRIIALETDGSLLMNTGVMCTLGNERPKNLTVLVFDNGLLEEVGGSPSHTSKNTDLALMAKGAGCINTATVSALEEFAQMMQHFLTDDEFGLIVAKIESGTDAWRPEQRKQTDGVEDKYRFIRYIEDLESIVIQRTMPGL